jgi:hypothetical protein
VSLPFPCVTPLYTAEVPLVHKKQIRKPDTSGFLIRRVRYICMPSEEPEHKLFRYIAANGRGRPLVSYEVIIPLIANTKARSGLKIMVRLDTGHYKTGKKISDEELQKINLKQSFLSWRLKLFYFFQYMSRLCYLCTEYLSQFLGIVML